MLDIKKTYRSLLFVFTWNHPFIFFFRYPPYPSVFTPIPTLSTLIQLHPYWALSTIGHHPTTAVLSSEDHLHPWTTTTGAPPQPLEHHHRSTISIVEPPKSEHHLHCRTTNTEAPPPLIDRRLPGITPPPSIVDTIILDEEHSTPLASPEQNLVVFNFFSTTSAHKCVQFLLHPKDGQWCGLVRGP